MPDMPQVAVSQDIRDLMSHRASAIFQTELDKTETLEQLVEAGKYIRTLFDEPEFLELLREKERTWILAQMKRFTRFSDVIRLMTQIERYFPQYLDADMRERVEAQGGVLAQAEISHLNSEQELIAFQDDLKQYARNHSLPPSVHEQLERQIHVITRNHLESVVLESGVVLHPPALAQPIPPFNGHCINGKVVRTEVDRFHCCMTCKFQGCLDCGQVHSSLIKCGDAAMEEENIRSILEKGARARPIPPPQDPLAEDFEYGKFRDCPYPDCRQIMERVDGCNSMRCTSCGRDFHWNYGIMQDVPHDSNPGSKGWSSEAAPGGRKPHF